MKRGGVKSIESEEEVQEPATKNKYETALGEALLTIKSPKVNLKRGSYRVTISYDTNDNTNTYSVSSAYNTWPVITSKQEIGFKTGAMTKSFTFSSPIKVEGYQVSANFHGNGYLFVDSISICETNVWKKLNLFWTAVLSLFVDTICVWRIRRRKEMDKEGKVVILSLFFLILFSSLPVFSVYLAKGHDMHFHLYRIEGVKDALLAGQFPVRVPYSWLNGFGYAVSIFYGDIFLYVPAFLRMAGMSVQGAYKLYMIGVNIATCLIAYYCLRKIFRDYTACLIGCAIYVLAPYRLICLHLRAAVGEYTAMVFLPLIAYGLYRIFMDETDTQEYKRCWIPAVLGFSGIIQCHVISCLMAGIFTLIVCIVLIRKTLQPRRLVLLVKVVIYTFLLTLWFILPFLDYMRFKYKVTDFSTLGWFNANGVFLSQLLSVFPHGTGDSYSVMSGLEMNGEMPYALGGGMMAVLVFYICYYVCRKKGERNFADRLGDFSLAFGLLAIFMSTVWFPWDFIQQLNGFCALLTQNIQFPWRFLGVVALFMSLLAACLVLVVGNTEERGRAYYMAGLIVVLSCLSAGSFLDEFMKEGVAKRYTEDNSISSYEIMGGEYLPVEAAKLQYGNDEPILGELLTVTDYERQNGAVTMSCKNEKDDETFTDLPLLYYKGYQAADCATGEKLTVLAGTDGRVRTVLPKGYEGTFRVCFQEPWYWRVSEVISAIMLLAVAAVCLKKRGMARYEK